MRRVIPFLFLWLCVGLCLFPQGCARDQAATDLETGGAPFVRVRLLQAQDRVMVSATHPANIHTVSEPVKAYAIPSTPVPVTLTARGWKIGSVTLGPGELTLQPTADGSVRVNGQAYRGRYRFVPVSSDRFDVVNDVHIDAYLKSVVSKELLWNWDDETYKAQAIVARTYALYESRTAPRDRHWDLHPDERSQVYGGIDAESSKSRSAVDQTAGVVLAYGREGQEKIFKAYFSACCGGITQSATDAFGDPYIVPLGDQKVGSLCAAAPNFNWGPVTISKADLTRRFRAWGARKNRPEKDMATIKSLEIQYTNRFGRPVRYVVTDARGARYSLTSEETRWAVNTDPQNGPTLYSSFFRPLSTGDSIKFMDGHGRGHGVGMCQWCAQIRAQRGLPHEQIVLLAYPKAKLARAY
jgi:stage II sporulation protein D